MRTYRPLRAIVLATCSIVMAFSAWASTADAVILINGRTDGIKLEWIGQDVSNCTAAGGYGSLWSGLGVPTSGSIAGGTGYQNWLKNTFTIPGDYVFHINCLDSSFMPISASTDVIRVTYPPSQVQVMFGAPGVNPFYVTPTLSFTVASTLVPKLGSTRLSWSFSDPAGTCVGSGGDVLWVGSKPTSGSAGTAPNSAMGTVVRTYKLTCTDSAGAQVIGQYPITFRGLLF